MAICEQQTSKNMKRNCDAPPLVQGVKEKYFVGHTSNVSALTKDSSNKLLVTGITMSSGKKLAIYEGYDLNTKPSIDTINRTDFDVLTPHKIQIALPYNDAATKAELQKVIKSKDLFFIYQKGGIGGEFEAMGLEVGMKATSISYDLAGDTKGAFIVGFEAPDANTLPHTVKHTTSNIDDTDAYLTGLSFTDV